MRRIKYMFIVFFLGLLGLFCGHISWAQSSLYSFREFTVMLEKYPPSKNPYTSVVITLDGKGVYRRIYKGRSYELEKNKTFKVSVEQLELLYYNIMRNNFFDMGKTFGNPNITEGNIIKVTVKIDYQVHTVTMYNERYLAMDDIINTILSVVPKKYARTFEDDYNGEDDRIELKID